MDLQSESEEARIIIESDKNGGYRYDIHGPGGDFTDGSIPVRAANKVRGLFRSLDGLMGGKSLLFFTRRMSSTAIGGPFGKCVEDLGQYLFDILDSNKQISRALALPRPPSSNLRMQFRFRDDEIETWPWELLYDGRESTSGQPFLALSPGIFMSRYREEPKAVPSPQTLDKLQVLLVTASPKDEDRIDHEVLRENLRLRTLLGQTSKHLELELLEHATLQSLKSYLTQAKHPFHVVHFICHGYFEKAGDDGFPETGVILEDENGQSDRVDAETLAEILHKGPQEVHNRQNTTNDAKFPYLVIIYACHSARTTFSVASALVDLGVPAVIGMRYPISPYSIPTFDDGLYLHLRDGFAIDEAVAKCREELAKFRGNREWLIPVLYLRAKDGVLFKFNSESKATAEWSERLATFREFLDSLATGTARQAAQATGALLKLGVSATVLLTAAALAYPLAAVRAAAVSLLRDLPHTREVSDCIVKLVDTALEYEQDSAVRYEMARFLLRVRRQGNASAGSLLRSLSEDPDVRVQIVARADPVLRLIQRRTEVLTSEVRSIVQADPILRKNPEQVRREMLVLLSDAFLPSAYRLVILLGLICTDLESVTTNLGQLRGVLRDMPRSREDYETYLEQVEKAYARTKALPRRITQLPRGTFDSAINESRHRYDFETHDLSIESATMAANEAIGAIRQVARAANLLPKRLAPEIDRIVEILEQELGVVQKLYNVLEAVDQDPNWWVDWNVIESVWE